MRVVGCQPRPCRAISRVLIRPRFASAYRGPLRGHACRYADCSDLMVDRRVKVVVERPRTDFEAIPWPPSSSRMASRVMASQEKLSQDYSLEKTFRRCFSCLPTSAQ